MLSVTSQKVQQLLAFTSFPETKKKKEKKRRVITPIFHQANCLFQQALPADNAAEIRRPSLHCLSAIAGLSSLSGTSDAQNNLGI